MDSTKEIITKSAHETALVGQKLAHKLKGEQPRSGARIVCLYGELGSGKTTFAQGFARGLDFSRRLPSPTFIIVRRYNLLKAGAVLYHLDLYRAQTKNDIAGLGLAEIFSDPSAIVLIEWAQRLGQFLPTKRTDVHFWVDLDGKHNIKIQSRS